MKKAITCLVMLTSAYADDSCQNTSEEVSMIQLNRMRDSVDSVDRLFDDLVEDPSVTAAMISQFNEEKRDALLQRAAEPHQWKQLVQKFRDLPHASKTNLIEHSEMSDEMGDIFNSLPTAYQTHALELIQEYDSEKATELEEVVAAKGSSSSGGGSSMNKAFGGKGQKKTTTTTTPSAQSKLVKKVTGNSNAASAVLNKFKSASTVARKLELLIQSVGNAEKATSSAGGAMTSFGSKLVSIAKDITKHDQAALWDGKWDQKDFEVFVKQGIDIFLKIVKTFLTMTIDLGTLAEAFDAILVILKQIVELAVSVTELIAAVGNSNIQAIQSVSAETDAVITRCSAEVKKITAAEKGLSPILKKWEKASPLERAGVIATNIPALKKGFEDLGEAWKSVQAFFNGDVKKLFTTITDVVKKLKTKLTGHKIPTTPIDIVKPKIPWTPTASKLFR